MDYLQFEAYEDEDYIYIDLTSIDNSEAFAQLQEVLGEDLEDFRFLDEEEGKIFDFESGFIIDPDTGEILGEIK